MFTFLTRKVNKQRFLDLELYYLIFNICFYATAWPYEDTCPSAKWSAMCRPCCEYHLIKCRCPFEGSRVGYTVPCCRNALDQCDPCIIHSGCSLFENCKTCNNGTWKAKDDFFIDGKYCTECRQGWSGGDCKNEMKCRLVKACGGIIQGAQGHIALESYPTNAWCEWTVQGLRDTNIELSFSRLSLESDHNCRYDYVEVRGGDDLSSPVIGRFCGDQVPPPIKSSGNVLHILFTSDGYNNFEGFALTFQESSAIRNPVCTHPEKLLNGYLQPAYGLAEEFVSVKYWCHPTFILTGSQQRTCLPNGTWSGTVPTCLKAQASRVQCPPPTKLLHGFHRPALDTAGGAEAIEFFCKNSYILSGNRQSTCLSNGSWSSRPPKCVRVCQEPKVSGLVQQKVVKPHPLSRETPNQRVHLSSRYSIHDLLSAGFIPLIPDRQSSAERNEGPSEEPPHGFHSLYTSIDYRCASPLFQHRGSSRRTCLRTGRWSGRHVSCSPVCGKFDNFHPHNLSDTLWPWHAAIYIRSPPYQAASSHGSLGKMASDQWEATEESTFWYLACSGALLNQRSVLVVAHCVLHKDTLLPLHPAHVKVVIGIQHQASEDWFQNQHHLRVSDILIHPNFYNAQDSCLAVLKLKEKAKISERVLPVCLPKMQGGEVTVQEAHTTRWVLPNNPRHLGRHAAMSQTEPVEVTDVASCERAFAQGATHTAAISDNTLCMVRKSSSSESPCTGVIPGLTLLSSGVSSKGHASWGHKKSQEAFRTNWQLLSLESFNCQRQTYTVQMRVDTFRDWIEKNMS